MMKLGKNISIMLSAVMLLIGAIAWPLTYAKDIPTDGSFLPSLDWQKVALESSISSKVKDALSTIVKSNQYVVDVEIKVNPPVKPKFTPNDDPAAAGGGEADNENKGKIKIRDVIPDQLPKDYIVFSKLGLEAPLIEDFKNFDQGQKGGEKGGDKKSEKDLPPFEQLWKFNKSLDIFNNLESVKVHVQLSENLHVATRDAIKKVLNSLKFNLNEITPELEISYINMEEKLAGMDLPTSVKDILALASRFANMIGLIMAAVLLGIIAFVLFNKWEKMEKDKQADAAAAAAPPPPKEEEKEKDQAGGAMGGGPFDKDNTDTSNGVDRFIAFMDHSIVEAVMLVKKWLNVGEKRERNALRALVQQMENNLLIKLFAKLSDSEREQWKSYLDQQVVGTDLVESNAFISNQIVEDILVPSAIVDADVADLLMRLTPEKGAEFVRDNPDLGKILMNVMNTKFVAKILDNLDDANVEATIARGLEYKKELVEKSMEDFKKKLVKYQTSQSKVPFMQKIMDLIPMANPARENALFKALVGNSENLDAIRPIALTYFPAVLIANLPDAILKPILQAYPIGKKVELVSSLEEDLRQKFTNIFAPAGSKSADVLELELEKISTDLMAQKKIRDQADSIWKEFVDFARTMIKANKERQGDFDNMATQWLEKIMAGESPEAAANGIDPERTSADGSLKAA